MTLRCAPFQLPVRLDFEPADGRAASWGRLEALTPGGARLTTLAALERGQSVLLSFEVGGEPFTELRAQVAGCAADADGFCAAELDIKDQRQRRRLARILLDALSR